MRSGITEALLLYRSIRTNLKRRSWFFGLSLDSRHNVFDVTKFLDDPWIGSVANGKQILGGIFNIDNERACSLSEAIDAINNPNDSPKKTSMYINSCRWIRDLQAVGGDGARKYARSILSKLFSAHKKNKKYWSSIAVDTITLSERIVNLIFSYSFVAAGSTDKFQKQLLSYISLQRSCLLKTYKGEMSSYSTFLALKAIFFCESALTHSNKRLLKKTLQKLYGLINELLDDDFFFTGKSPVIHLDIFRSLIEIRFIVNRADIPIDNEFFQNTLSMMGYYVRYFRLGDGLLTNRAVSKLSHLNYSSFSSQNIDTSLSLIDSDTFDPSDDKKLICQRIATKNLIILINTAINRIRSTFNSSKEPGVNIFDFECSIGLDRIINRCDIAILANNSWLAFPRGVVPIFKKDMDHSKKNIVFEGSVSYNQGSTSIEIDRKIDVAGYASRIDVFERARVGVRNLSVLRCVFHRDSVIEQISPHSFEISLHESKFRLNVSSISGGDSKILIKSQLYPSLHVIIRAEQNSDVCISWSIERCET